MRGPPKWVVWVGMAVAALGAGCSGGTGPEAEGLVPGTYTIRFELGSTIATPEPLRGRHDVTFRVRAPAASAADVDLVSSRRIPPEGATETGYLSLDRSLLTVAADRWQLRFPYAEGDFAVSFTLRGVEGGGIVAPAGCYGRSGATASFLGAGCVIERQ